MRLSEAKAMIQSLQAKIGRYAAEVGPAMAAMDHVTPEFAQAIADCLVTALQLARAIIADRFDPVSRAQLSEWVGREMVGQIDDCLRSAKASFPHAESFKTPDDVARR
jgi:hypothetical protein